MKSIEEAVELHHAIRSNAPHPSGLYQIITASQGWAKNQEAERLDFRSRIALNELDAEAQRLLLQGFGCVEVNIRALWGGCFQDGTPRTGTEVSIQILDRLAGSMARRTWESNGAGGSVKIADTEVLPLLRKLLRPEPENWRLP